MSIKYTIISIMNDSENPNPYGFLKSLQEGQEWVDMLERELLELVNDLMNFQDGLSETGVAALKYTITKTEEAIQQIEIEMKMFDE